MSFSQQGRANTRALKSHYPRPFPFVGELWLQMTGAYVQSMKGYEPRHEKTNILVSDLV